MADHSSDNKQLGQNHSAAFLSGKQNPIAQNSTQRFMDVVLLMADLKEARELASVFKKVGINPIIYTEFAAFWQGLLQRPPALAVVDVFSMGQGHLPLKEHPLVMSHQLPLTFFYKDEHRPLLNTTLDFAHYGLIKRQADYQGPIKSVLLRVNQHLHLENKINQLQYELVKDQELLKQSRAREIELAEKYECLLEIHKFNFQLSDLRDVGDFIQWPAKILDQWDWCRNFAVYRFTANGKTLFSPPLETPKYKSLPNLPLAGVATGISNLSVEDYARNPIEIDFAEDRVDSTYEALVHNLASQMAIQHLGAQVVSFTLNCGVAGENIYLFVQIGHPVLASGQVLEGEFQPPWSMVENLLNGAYAQWRNFHFLRKPTALKSMVAANWLPFHSMLGLADGHFYDAKTDLQNSKISHDKEWVFVGISLSAIDGLIKRETSNRFFWQKFAYDFEGRLQSQLTSFDKAYFTLANPYTYIVAVMVKDLSKALGQLRDFTNRFSFWRYFETPDKLFLESPKIVVRQIPQSADALLNFADNPETQYTTVTNRFQGKMEKSTAVKVDSVPTPKANKQSHFLKDTLMDL